MDITIPETIPEIPKLQPNILFIRLFLFSQIPAIFPF